MKNSKKTVDTLKKVSADTKNLNLALPLSPAITMGEIKKSCRIGVGADLQSPNVIFALLIGTKEVCTTAHLNEMFHLNDAQRSYVFSEGSVDRDYNITELAYHILEIDCYWDAEGRPITLELSPAQQKLRAILVKCIKYERFREMAEELEENFGTDILYEVAFDMRDKFTVTEEEVLDALNTYQAEHQA